MHVLRVIKFLSVVVLCIIMFFASFVGYYVVKAVVYKLDYSVSYVYKCLPVLIIIDPKGSFFHDNEQIGAQIGPVIILGDSDSETRNTLSHELEHVRQGYPNLFLWSIYRYNTNTEYKILCEYDAYKAEDNNFRDDVIVEILHDSGYNIGMSRKQIYKIIEENR